MRIRHIAALLAFAASGCATVAAPPPPPAPVALTFDGFGILTGPPAAGSPQDAADVATARGPWPAARLAQAAADDVFDPWSAFAPVLGADFNAARYPATKKVFDQFLADVGPPIGITKAKWQRPRPFIANPAQATCIVPTEALRASGSYPSGHSAAGWGWGLLLAEIAPDKADALLHRGFDYGESRIVCGVHWASDVSAGRALGAAAVARMHADPGTRDLIAAAHAEMMNAGAPH